MNDTQPQQDGMFSRRVLLAVLLGVALAALLILWQLGLTAQSGQAVVFVAIVLFAAAVLGQFVRGRFRLSVRTMLIWMTVLGVLFGIIGGRMIEARRHAAAVARIQRLGGNVGYDFPMNNEADGWFTPRLGVPLPTWFRTVLGDDLFADVVSISLWGPEVSDDALQTLADDFPELIELSLGQCAITRKGMDHVARLEKLESIQFSDVALEAHELAPLQKLPSLQRIMFSGVFANDSTLETVSQCTGVEAIIMWNVSVTDDGLKHLDALPRLKALSINGSVVGDSGMRHIAKLSGLETLMLNSTMVTDDGLAELHSLTGLRHFSLNRNAAVTPDGAEAIRAALPECQVNHH